MTSDSDLLRQFARDHAQDAFTELVKRHVNLVYSAALRQVRSPQLAEEIAQSVFADLAHAALKLKPDTILTAWLYAVTRRTAIDVIRKESRRRLREQIAAEMNAMNATEANWTHIEPLLDEAVSALDETDRAAVLLRYFENKSLREVGQQLGMSDDAAQKRVSRAVEKLREFFCETKNDHRRERAGDFDFRERRSIRAGRIGNFHLRRRACGHGGFQFDDNCRHHHQSHCHDNLAQTNDWNRVDCRCWRGHLRSQSSAATARAKPVSAPADESIACGQPTSFRQSIHVNSAFACAANASRGARGDERLASR